MSVPPGSMSDQQEKPARHAGNLRIGDLVVCRLGYGAMRITGDGAWAHHGIGRMRSGSCAALSISA